MAWVKKGLMIAGVTVVGLLIINLLTRQFLPGVRPYLGLS